MTAEPRKWTLAALVLLAAAAGGFWLARDVVNSATADREGERARKGTPLSSRQIDPPNPDRKSQPRTGTRASLDLDELLISVPKERIITFKSDEAYRRFLDSLKGSNLRLLGQIDRLRALRIGFDDLADLEALLDDDAEAAGNYYVSIPPLPEVGAQAGAAGFGRATLEWLGITSDNSAWGAGVRIAILDTGVGSHSAFPNGIREIDLVTKDGSPVELHGHGTAVASLIVGNDSISQGIAPSADLLSIRIGDQDGNSSSFLLAEGILAAVDAGAQLINISLGSYGNSSLVRSAIDYAAERGVVLVASAGNDGLGRPAYPAAYENVIAVGAVDANGQHLAFSNTGDALDVGAPGYEIVSAWPDNNFTSFSGTSASAPIVVGSIAAAMSEIGPSHAVTAANLVMGHLNAAGAPGDDPQYGKGVIDVGRVMNSETPGIYDGAVAANWYEGPAEGAATGTLLVTVENRGTAPFTNAGVEVSVEGGVFRLTVPSLTAGQTQVFSLPVNAPSGAERVTVQSSLTLRNGTDVKPANNSLSGEIILVTPDPGAETADNGTR